VIISAASLTGDNTGGDRGDKGIACPAEVGEAMSEWRLVMEGTLRI
jgi:hypothetical protein